METANQIKPYEVPLLISPERTDRVALWHLVLLTADIPHRFVEDQEGWQLLVPQTFYENAQREIAAYETENQNWPPSRIVDDEVRDDGAAWIAILGLLLVFSITGPWSGGMWWFERGAVSAVQIIREGQWWRAVTALTLHADASHLLGNLFFGGFLLSFLGRHLGSGLGLCLALAAGAFGNFLNVVFRSTPHLSVGFSTAVFGMIGVFCGLRWLQKRVSLREVLLPIGAALGLLAFLGTEGERTDLGAHFWGLVVGILFGVVVSQLKFLVKKSQSGSVQNVLLISCSCFVWFCWYIALSVK